MDFQEHFPSIPEWRAKFQKVFFEEDMAKELEMAMKQGGGWVRQGVPREQAGQ